MKIKIEDKMKDKTIVISVYSVEEMEDNFKFDLGYCINAQMSFLQTMPDHSLYTIDITKS